MKTKTNLNDNAFFRAMGTVGDLVVLNLLWLLCCLPVVTLGASTATLFHVTGKMAAGEVTVVWRDFLGFFRREWKAVTKLWLPLLAFGLLVAADLYIGGHTASALGGLLTAGAVIFGLLWLCVTTWSFALLGRFQYRRGREVLRDALALAAANLPTTLVAVVLALLVPALLLLAFSVFVYLLPFFLLAGGSAASLILAVSMRPTFAHMEKLAVSR
ncbi:MAG: YesL family protein [Clostridiales bacterium]|nr:YesL family protein [Clostridiales bacterium]